MLILTRKNGQGFMISDDVQVIILNNKNGEVEVGISAPRSVPVLRTELLRQSDSHVRFNVSFRRAGVNRKNFSCIFKNMGSCYTPLLRIIMGT